MNAEFDRWVQEHFPSDSMERLNKIMPRETQIAILDAALLAHDGDETGAEAARQRAGYGVAWEFQKGMRPIHGGFPDAA